MVALAAHVHFRALIGGKLFLLFYPAIFFGALCGGLGPGLFAVALAILSVWYFVIPPAYTFGIRDLGDALGLIVFTITSTAAVVLGSRVRSSRLSAEAAKNKLTAANDVLARYAEMVASSDDAIASKSLDGRFTSWNKAAERIFGYSSAEMIGRPIDILIPNEFKGEEKTIIEKLSRGERIEHYDTKRMRKDGTVVEVSVTLSPIKNSDGKIIGACKIAHDITERKLTQLLLEKKTTELEILNQKLEVIVAERTNSLRLEAARRAEAVEDLRLAQQAAHIGSFNWNVQTGVNTWSPELEAMYGLPRGTFPKTQAAWEELVHPDDRARAIETVNRAFNTFQPEEGEWRVTWPDGSTRWLTGRFQVYRDSSGKPAHLAGVNIDITDRKVSELALRDLTENLERKVRERTRELRERDEKLNFTMRSAQAGAWDWNIETGTLEWDAAVFTIFGVPFESFKPSFARFLELVHPDDRESTKTRVLEAVERDQDFEGDYRVIWPDKSTHHILARGKSYRNSAGKPSHMVGICWDVTQRKQEELGRLRAEQKFRAVMESAPDAILLINSNGEIISTNAQSETLFGYSREEMIGQTIEKLLPTEAREKHVSQRDQFLRSPQTRSMAQGRNLSALSKDGRLISVEVSLSPGKAGDEFFVMAVVRDVTERKQAESQLRTLAAVVESSNDFIGICNPDMSPIYVNEAGMRMVGLGSMEEVKQTRTLDYFWPEDRPMIEKEAIPTLAATGKWSGICRFRNFKTGEPIHTIWNAFLIRDRSGKPTAWGTVSPNLNQLKASEEQIRAALTEKEVLLREIHHRVKNNLNIISSLLELQAMGIKDRQIRDAFIESQNRVMSMALIHEKLYQSKNLARLDFANYVNDLVLCIYYSYGKDLSLIRPDIQIGKTDLDIDTAIPCSLIINELVSNSLKHAFPEQKTGHVLISLQPVKGEPNTFELEVSDDGVGFPMEMHLEGTRSLGLKLVQSLTKQLGGTLIKNGSKTGADFKIRFAPKRKKSIAYAYANSGS